MARIEPTVADRRFLQIAFEEARIGSAEGGVPVGACLVRDADGEVLARGRNRLQQESNPVLHGEINCLRQYGRSGNFARVTLYTSLSPCAMCAGAVVLFGISRIIVGDDRNFAGEIDWLLSRGVDVGIENDADMIAFFTAFTRERPKLWGEDIKGYPHG